MERMVVWCGMWGRRGAKEGERFEFFVLRTYEEDLGAQRPHIIGKYKRVSCV